MRFTITYKKDGLIRHETIYVNSIESLEKELKSRNIHAIEIRQNFSFLDELFSKQPTTREIINMFYHLKLALKANLSINEALNGIIDNTSNRTLKIKVQKILFGINSGKTIDRCFREANFSDFICSMISVGQKSGNIPVVLEFIISHLKNNQKNNKLLKKAISYPLFVLIVMICVFLGISLVVLPQFEALFLSIKGELPLASRSLLFIKNALVEYWVLILLAIISIYVTLHMCYRKHKTFKENISRAILKIPFLGVVIYHYELYIFFLSFYQLYKNKIHIKEALQTSIQSINNEYIKQQTKNIYKHINVGSSMQESFLKINIWDNLTKQLIKSSSDENGFLESIETILELHKDELENKSENLFTIIEPTMILLLGILVLWLALGIFLPLWELPTQTRM